MSQEPSLFDDTNLDRVLGVRAPHERGYVQSVVEMIQKLDRGLLPPPAPHPYASLMAEGTAGIAPLLDILERGDPKAQGDALDALAHIVAGTRLAPAIARLKMLLASTQDPERAALLEKTLALAGDEATLLEQMKRLADDDPAVVASAARLCGLGRYAPAVPVLKALVSPERIYESRWVIWALGEIGDAAALPALDMALAHAFRVTDCLIAMGKIGEVVSLPKITPHLVSGMAEQKDAAARALAMILHKHRSETSAVVSLRPMLAALVERELADAAAPISGSTRFHLLLCLARLGHKLDEARVKKYLGGTFAPASGKNLAALRVKAAPGGKGTPAARGRGRMSATAATPPRKPSR